MSNGTTALCKIPVLLTVFAGLALAGCKTGESHYPSTNPLPQQKIDQDEKGRRGGLGNPDGPPQGPVR